MSNPTLKRYNLGAAGEDCARWDESPTGRMVFAEDAMAYAEELLAAERAARAEAEESEARMRKAVETTRGWLAIACNESNEGDGDAEIRAWLKVKREIANLDAALAPRADGESET